MLDQKNKLSFFYRIVCNIKNGQATDNRSSITAKTSRFKLEQHFTVTNQFLVYTLLTYTPISDEHERIF